MKKILTFLIMLFLIGGICASASAELTHILFPFPEEVDELKVVVLDITDWSGKDWGSPILLEEYERLSGDWGIVLTFDTDAEFDSADCYAENGQRMKVGRQQYWLEVYGLDCGERLDISAYLSDDKSVGIANSGYSVDSERPVYLGVIETLTYDIIGLVFRDGSESQYKLGKFTIPKPGKTAEWWLGERVFKVKAIPYPPNLPDEVMELLGYGAGAVVEAEIAKAGSADSADVETIVALKGGNARKTPVDGAVIGKVTEGQTYRFVGIDSKTGWVCVVIDEATGLTGWASGNFFPKP